MTDDYGYTCPRCHQTCGERGHQDCVVPASEFKAAQKEIERLRAALAENEKLIFIVHQVGIMFGVTEFEHKPNTLHPVLAATEEAKSELERLRAALVNSDAGMQTLRQQHQTACDERDAMKRTLTASRDDVWLWQGQGDEPESLVCPVVMSADTLRDILKHHDLVAIQKDRDFYRDVCAGEYDDDSSTDSMTLEQRCAIAEKRVAELEQKSRDSWAAYVGCDAMLKASEERERIIQDHRERACARERDAIEERDRLAATFPAPKVLSEAIREIAAHFEGTHFVDGMLRLASMAGRLEWTCALDVTQIRAAQARAIRWVADETGANQDWCNKTADAVESGEVEVPR